MATGRLWEALTDPVSCLYSEGMERGTKGCMFEENTGDTEAGTPHAFNRGVLLRSIYYSRPVGICSEDKKSRKW